MCNYYINENTTDKVTTNIRIEQIFKERGNKAVLHLAKLTESFPECSLMIIYPDQNGQPQDTMTFTAPQRQEKESAYSTIIKWFEKTFKKK